MGRLPQTLDGLAKTLTSRIFLYTHPHSTAPLGQHGGTNPRQDTQPTRHEAFAHSPYFSRKQPVPCRPTTSASQADNQCLAGRQPVPRRPATIASSGKATRRSRKQRKKTLQISLKAPPSPPCRKSRREKVRMAGKNTKNRCILGAKGIKIAPLHKIMRTPTQ